VTIPAGVSQGQLIRLSGQGGAGFGGGKAGDLFLRVHIEPEQGVLVDGRDVTMPVFVTPWEAALGALVEVSTPGGALSVTIPEGSVAGRRLRLKGKGIPGGRGGAVAGDLYLELKIAVPSAVTDEQRKRGKPWLIVTQALIHEPIKQGDDIMTNQSTSHSADAVQMLEAEALPVEEIARLCCVSMEWLEARIEQEIIYAVRRDGRYYLSGAMVYRVQQVAKIEQTYEADPQLAALVADLMHEVQQLRRQLNR